MKVKDVEDALAMLADVAWWMKGFSAARPAPVDDGCDDLEGKANALRVWIVGLTRGTRRRVAFADEERILISLPEFEALRDGLQPFTADDARNAGILVDRAAAFNVSCRILAGYRREEAEANNVDLPF
jgi:hypothetical protein